MRLLPVPGAFGADSSVTPELRREHLGHLLMSFLRGDRGGEVVLDRALAACTGGEVVWKEVNGGRSLHIRSLDLQGRHVYGLTAAKCEEHLGAKKIVFERCNFACADLSGARLGTMEFEECELRAAVFRDVRADQLSLLSCNLSNMVLEDADIGRLDIVGGDMSGVDIRGLRARHARLEGLLGWRRAKVVVAGTRLPEHVWTYIEAMRAYEAACDAAEQS